MLEKKQIRYKVVFLYSIIIREPEWIAATTSESLGVESAGFRMLP